LDKAPLYTDVAEGPPGGTAYWVTARDGVRLRIAYWTKGTKGTVLLFPGRTEYIEKYGRTAAQLAAQGFATAVIDWRGQGLSDRLAEPAMLGHVGSLRDYQYDVEALVRAGEVLRFPMPWFVLSHSMGGAIALRALSNGLRVKAAVFSAPMWGIKLSKSLRPVAWTLGAVTRNSRLSRLFAPGTRKAPYTEVNPFKNNLLTRDKDSYDYMTRQTKTYPALGLGGPSIHWIYESLIETRRLRKQKQPDVPSLTWIGDNERIIDVQAVHEVTSNWPGAGLEVVPDAEHELLMEVPSVRDRFVKASAAFFERHI
jgi:lysophospholipase